MNFHAVRKSVRALAATLSFARVSRSRSRGQLLANTRISYSLARFGQVRRLRSHMRV